MSMCETLCPRCSGLPERAPEPATCDACGTRLVEHHDAGCICFQEIRELRASLAAEKARADRAEAHFSKALGAAQDALAAEKRHWEAKWLREKMRARGLEADVDALNRTCNEGQARERELEADCAAMRRALVFLHDTAGCQNGCEPDDMTCATNVAVAALASDAGKRLLEELASKDSEIARLREQVEKLSHCASCKAPTDSNCEGCS